MQYWHVEQVSATQSRTRKKLREGDVCSVKCPDPRYWQDREIGPELGESWEIFGDLRKQSFTNCGFKLSALHLDDPVTPVPWIFEQVILPSGRNHWVLVARCGLFMTLYDSLVILLWTVILHHSSRNLNQQHWSARAVNGGTRLERLRLIEDPMVDTETIIEIIIEIIYMKLSSKLNHRFY